MRSSAAEEPCLRPHRVLRHPGKRSGLGWRTGSGATTTSFRITGRAEGRTPSPSRSGWHDDQYDILFLDRAEFAAGDDWEVSGGPRLRNTKRLVLVATREALTASDPVAPAGRHLHLPGPAGDPDRLRSH